MKKEIHINYIDLIKKICLTYIFSIWFIIPLLKELKQTSLVAVELEYYFIQLVGIVGIYLLVFNIYKDFKKREDKKGYLKEILPIFILGLYMIWTLISSVFSPNINKAFYGTEYRKEGYITYLCYAGFFSCAFLLNSQKIKKILLNIFIIISMLNIAFIELANHSYFLEIFLANDISTAVFKNSNHYGYYLLLVTSCSTLLFITEKKKIIKSLYALAYIYLLYYFILNNTFGCYLAMFATLISFFVYCIYKKKKIYSILISIIIFIVLSCCVTSDGKNIVINNILGLNKDINKIESGLLENEKDWEKAGSGRMKLWKYGIEFFLQNPVLGYGPENLKAKYAEVNIIQDRPHNLIIQLATTSGFPGLILYIIAIGLIIKRGVKNIDLENNIHTTTLFTVIAYLLSAMFGNSMYYTSPYFFILLGFLMYENIKKEGENK